MDRQSFQSVLLILIAIAAIGGAWIAGALLSSHGGGWTDGDAPLMFALCGDATASSSQCSDVLDGRWGAFDVTVSGKRVVVPTSFLGLAYFIFVTAWFSLLGRLVFHVRTLRLITLALVGCGLCSSLFFTGLMALGIESWCPLCTFSHTLSVSVFVLFLLGWRSARTFAPAFAYPTEPVFMPAGSTKLACLAVTIATFAIGGAWLYYEAIGTARHYWRRSSSFEQTLTKLQDNVDFVQREFYASSEIDIKDDNSANWDDQSYDYPVLVVFGRYDCSACRCFSYRAHGMIHPLFADGIVIEHRPVLPELLEEDSRSSASNSYAVQSAYAMEAARMQGDARAWGKLHNLLLRGQDHIKHDFRKLAKRAGLDSNLLIADMNSDAVKAKVLASARLADQLGVTKTPAVLLNRRRVPDICLSSNVFWQSIAEDWNAASRSTLASKITIEDQLSEQTREVRDE